MLLLKLLTIIADDNFFHVGPIPNAKFGSHAWAVEVLGYTFA